MPGPIYTCLTLPLGDQFKFQTVVFTLWFLAELSRRLFWCSKSIMMFLKERVPRSHVSQKGSVTSPNAFHEAKGCWFAQSANDYMPPVQGATLGLETQRWHKRGCHGLLVFKMEPTETFHPPAHTTKKKNNNPVDLSFCLPHSNQALAAKTFAMPPITHIKDDLKFTLEQHLYA